MLNADFRTLTQLQILRLNGNKISDVGPLRKLPTVEEIELQGNLITDIAPLAELPALESLDLSNNQLSDITAVCAALNKFPVLSFLIIQGEQEPTYQNATLTSPRARCA